MTLLHMLRVAVAIGLAAAGLVAAAPATYAVEPPEPDKVLYSETYALQNPNENTVVVLGMRFSTASGDGAPEGTHAVISAYSCGLLLGTETYTLARDAEPSAQFFLNEAQQRKVGPSIQHVGEFTHPGYDNYRVTGSYDGYDVRRPSCQEIRHPLRVTWSAKQGVARVGRVVSVSSTTADRATVSYRWILRRPRMCTESGCSRRTAAVVGRARSLRVVRPMLGGSLSIRVQVAKRNYTTKTRVLTFGRVR